MLFTTPCTSYRRQKERLPAAFHLPEVCRQIYSETALTAYTHSTFIVGEDCLTFQNDLNFLQNAQRRAISSIEPDYKALAYRVKQQIDHDRRIRIDPSSRLAPNKTFKWRYFPNLKTIVVTKVAFRYMQLRVTSGPKKGTSREKWQEWLTELLQRGEGKGVEVEFKDPDPSW